MRSFLQTLEKILLDGLCGPDRSRLQIREVVCDPNVLALKVNQAPEKHDRKPQKCRHQMANLEASRHHHTVHFRFGQFFDVQKPVYTDKTIKHKR